MELRIQNPWLDWIISGKKTVEGRVGKPGDRDHLISKEIDIYNPNDIKDRVKVKIISIKHYPNLDDYLEGELGKVSLPEDTYYIAYQRHMNVEAGGRKVFDFDRIEREGGINALYLELV